MRNAGFVFHGDSTTRNMQGPLQELLRFAAAPDVAVAARYYAEKIVAATRAAVAKARTEGSKNKTRHSLRLIYPGTADDKGTVSPPRTLNDALRASRVSRSPDTSPNCRVMILEKDGRNCSDAFDAESYHGFANASVAKVNHDAVLGVPVWPGNDNVRRIWVMNYGLHVLHAHPGRPLTYAKDANYVSDFADVAHGVVRWSLARGALARTALVWRHTNFVCDKNLYGAWDAALRSLESEPRTAAAPLVKSCVDDARRERPPPRRRYGTLSPEAMCANVTIDAYGSAFLNGVAEHFVDDLNACWVGGATRRPGFPCPDDVRGVAGREAWPLPGLRILRADAISRTFCGVVKGDAVHTRHNHPLLARVLFAMLEFL